MEKLKRFNTMDEIPHGWWKPHELVQKSGRFFDLVTERTHLAHNPRPGDTAYKTRDLIYLKATGELIKDVTNWYSINNQPSAVFDRLEEEANQVRIRKAIENAACGDCND